MRLHIGEEQSGVFSLVPSLLVDFEAGTQCAFGDDKMAVMLEVRCDQPRIAIYRACDSLSLVNGAFSFEASEDPPVTVRGSCDGRRCTGTVSARTTLDPQCSHPEKTWVVNLATE
jgi:hypothetical protein